LNIGDVFRYELTVTSSVAASTATQSTMVMMKTTFWCFLEYFLDILLKTSVAL